MGCAVSTASPGLPPLSSEASLAHKPECHPRVLTDLGMRPPHQSTARHSHGTSTATQPHITSMRNSATTAAAAATTAAAPDPLPDPLGQICVPVKETAAATSASPNEYSSTRLSLTQLRPATISHSTILSVQATSSAQSRSHVTASEEKDAAEPQTRTPPSPPMHELQPHTPPQQLHLRDVQEQYRLSEQSMQRSTSLLELIDSLSTTSPAMARHEQHAARRSPTYNSLKRQTSATPPEQTTPPTVQVSLHRASGSTNGNTHIVPNAEKSATSPKPPSLPVDAADGSGLKFEYMAEEGNFDINSSDEDDSDSDSGDPLHIIVSRSTATPTIDRQETSLLQRLPQPPSVSAATAAASPRVSTPAGLGFRLQPIARSASLVSLAEGPDDMFGPSTPHGTDGVRFGSMSPDFNGLPTANNSRPASSFLASTSNVGRVDQVADNGLATFFNQPRECASCKSPTVAFACEVCDDFFLCEDCRFNVAVVRAIHDPTHAMLSIQDNHCGSSRTFGGDSIFSLSGEGGASSLFNPPCSRCGRVIDDTEAVYRCEQCDYVLCLECFFKPPETVTADTDSPHEHILKRFQRKSKPGSVHESVVVSKSRSRGGNRVINDYVVVRLLGRGSYAKVKLVQHIRTQELFALKILKKQKKASTSGMNLGRSRVKMASAGVSEDDLLREIAVMKFIDHPNITKLKEVIEDVEAQKVYVIMEYCENGPVHVLDTPPLELEQVRQYGADIMRGLQHLHSEFLYHRDVKPANCLVNHECVVKIADFGTCNSQIRTKTSDGTLAFSCPEQVRGEEVSGEVVDSWAFALTLYEMAYGTLPVSTTSLLQHRNMLLGPEPIPIPESGDPQLRDLLAAMLRKKLKERVLLSAAAQHPFFRAFQIDPHGSPYNSMQLAASRHQQQLQQSLLSRGEDEASPASPSPQQQPSPPPQQQQQQQPGTLSELYSLALESVHRGKNLKDCFHGVRAVRRIRRKEVEMARHGSGDPGLGCADDDDDDDDSGFYAADKDVDSSGVLRSADAGMPSPMHSGAMLYGYGSSADSVSEGNSSAVAEAPSRGTGNTTPSKDGEAVAAAKEVEELVQHHLASKESKIEVSYVQLVQQSTVEKLNQLAARAVDFRLTHNALASITALRFGAFHALKELCISFNRLENFPVEVLAAPRLMRLDLSHNRISSISPALVTNAPFLERLNLHHNFITYVGTVPCGAPTPNAASPASPVKAKSAWDAPRKGAAAGGGGGGGAAPTKINGAASGDNAAETRMVSVLAAPCLRHVRLSGNPLEALPLALETTHRLELVLDAIPALMEQWKDYPQTRLTQQSPPHQPQQQQPSQDASANMTTSATMVPPTMSHSGVRAGSAPTAVVRAGLSAPTQATRLPAIIVWDDSFPVRIPDVEPAVWLAVNNMAVYRVQTLRTCQARRVVLCQCADPRFPNGVFDSADLEAYFNELAKALQERQLKRKGNGSAPGSGGANEVVNSALPPIVSRAARSYVESYFFVTDDESEEDGGYHSLVEYLNEALAAREPVLVVVMSNANASAVRTNIVAALSTSLTLLRGKEPDDVGEQVEMVVSTMRSLYA